MFTINIFELMLKVEEIRTIEDMQNYVEGCINDYEAGISTKDELMAEMQAYTMHIIKLNIK